jgi:hypothetical protein
MRWIATLLAELSMFIAFLPNLSEDVPPREAWRD